MFFPTDVSSPIAIGADIDISAINTNIAALQILSL